MILALLLLGLIPVPQPTPSVAASSSPALRTIVTVKSSPYCNSLAQHFNSAFVPMNANDRTLDRVDLQLDDLNDLFTRPDYVSRFVEVRTRLARYVDVLLKSLPPIKEQIAQLRAGAALTTDAGAAAAVRDAADQLQRAYVKQRAMAIDLQGLVQGMMDYDIMNAPHPVGGTSPQDNTIPADMKNIKSYLRFDGQRDVIAQAEEKAVDTAYNAATTACTDQ